MVVSIKKTLVMVLLVLVLLAGLFGWSILAAMHSAGVPYNTGLHSSGHLLASGDGDNDSDDGGVGTDADDTSWYCPPPPRVC